MTEPKPSAEAGYQVVIPQLGLTMKEASILEWLIPDGAWVEKGQPLFTLENEKSVVEVEAPATGRLSIQVDCGVTVPVLHPVAILIGSGQVAAYHAVSTPETAKNQLQETKYPTFSERIKPVGTDKVAASPKARIAARAKGIDLGKVTGSGIRGMITLCDLENAVSHAEKSVSASPLARKIAEGTNVDLHKVSGSGPHGRIMRDDVEKYLSFAMSNIKDDRLTGLSGLRAIIADRLSQSWRERPHVTLTTEVDVTCLVAFRNEVNALFIEKAPLSSEPVKISYNALLVKLVAESISAYPNLNVSLTSDGICEHKDIHIGIAVDTDRGLMVPVIKDVKDKNLVEIQDALKTVAKRAQEGRSRPEDLEGATFTITNLGAYGIDAFTPIINPPESAILGVGRILPRPVGVEGSIVLRETVVLSLTFDHRLIDGAPAARFLQILSELLKNPPKSLLLDHLEGRNP